MKLSFLLLLTALLVNLSSRGAFAQQPAIRPAPTPAAIDSTRRGLSASDTVPDLIRSNGKPIRVGQSVLTDDDTTSLDRPDTVQVSARQEAQIPQDNPEKGDYTVVDAPRFGAGLQPAVL